VALYQTVLQIPGEWRLAKKEYRDSNDHLTAFIEERCVTGSTEFDTVVRKIGQYPLWGERKDHDWNSANLSKRILGTQVHTVRLLYCDLLNS